MTLGQRRTQALAARSWNEFRYDRAKSRLIQSTGKWAVIAVDLLKRLWFEPSGQWSIVLTSVSFSVRMVQ